MVLAVNLMSLSNHFCLIGNNVSLNRVGCAVRVRRVIHVVRGVGAYVATLLQYVATVCAGFLDIFKAFDKVWHDGLIFKLKQNGISGSLFKLLANYLNNRKHRVVLNGSCSDYSEIESGVPQGSVLGPLLFLIYINDLERNIKSNINFFADDTMLFSIVKDPVISGDDLNHDLDIIHQWVHQWEMEFNPNPTKQATEVLFSCKRSQP